MNIKLCPKTGKIMNIYFQNTPLLVEAPLEESLSILQENTPFTIIEAWGCDECWPSIAPYIPYDVRCHGELWRRPLFLQKEDQDVISTLWQTPWGNFSRKIKIISKENSMNISFEYKFPKTATHNNITLESLFANHALFQIEENDLLQIFEKEKLLWERKAPPPSQKEAFKLYFSGNALRSILKKEALTLHITSNLPHLGLWWCNNGWGDGREHKTAGIEPTTHPSDGPIFTSFSLEECCYEIQWNIQKNGPLV